MLDKPAVKSATQPRQSQGTQTQKVVNSQAGFSVDF